MPINVRGLLPDHLEYYNGIIEHTSGVGYTTGVLNPLASMWFNKPIIRITNGLKSNIKDVVIENHVITTREPYHISINCSEVECTKEELHAKIDEAIKNFNSTNKRPPMAKCGEGAQGRKLFDGIIAAQTELFALGGSGLDACFFVTKDIVCDGYNLGRLTVILCSKNPYDSAVIGSSMDFEEFMHPHQGCFGDYVAGLVELWESVVDIVSCVNAMLRETPTEDANTCLSDIDPMYAAKRGDHWTCKSINEPGSIESLASSNINIIDERTTNAVCGECEHYISMECGVRHVFPYERFKGKILDIVKKYEKKV